MENGLLFIIMCYEYLSSQVVLQHGIAQHTPPWNQGGQLL